MSAEIIGLIIAFGVLTLALGGHVATTSHKNGKLEERLDQTAGRQKEDRDAREKAQKDLEERHGEIIEKLEKRHAEVTEKQEKRHEDLLREVSRKHEADNKEVTTKVERWVERDTAQDAARQKHLEDKIDRLAETINQWGQAFVGFDSRVRTIEKMSGISGQTPAVLPRRQGG